LCRRWSGGELSILVGVFCGRVTRFGVLLGCMGVVGRWLVDVRQG